MKRETLATLGLSEEQIEKIMTEYGKDIQAINAKATKNNEELQRLQQIEEEYIKLKDSNLTEIEKANKERDKALNSVGELQKKIRTMELKSQFIEKGITGENADKLIESLNTGSFDVGTLGAIISEREMAAAQAKEKEIADKANNPGGGNAGPQNNDVPSEGEKYAKLYNSRYAIQEE